MNEVRWLLVGAGDIARKRVAAALTGTRNSSLVAICSRTRENALALANQHGQAEVFTDLAEALTHSAVTAVYLATPVWLHVSQAVQVLEAGKHVLIEKPLGLNASECTKIIAVAGRAGRLAGCAYYRRFYPRYIYTKEILDKGELGPVVSVDMMYSSWYNPEPGDPKSWRVVKAKSGGGVVMDMGCHMFDVMIGLFGLPKTVYGQCGNLVHRWDVEDSMAVVMRLRNDTLVEARFNWNTKMWQHQFEIVGTEGKIAWSTYDSGPVLKTRSGHTEHLDLPAPANVHAPLVEEFVQSILANRTPQCDATEAVKTNILLDAVYESAATGREIKVDGVK